MAKRTEELLAEVERAFSPELQTGALKVVEHRYFPEAFGDEVVILEGRGLRLKLKHERSEYYALVASVRAPEEWERLQTVVNAVTGSAVSGAVEVLGWELSVNEAAALFRQHGCELAGAYSSWWRWRSTRKRIRELRKVQQERLREHLASIRRDA